MNATLDRAHRSDTLDHVASAGLVAFGVVHLVLGWLAFQLALGDREGGASTTGAIRQLAEQPLGAFLVWAVAVGMALLTVWQGVEAAVGNRDRDGWSRTWRRLRNAGRAVVYGVITASAFSVAAGSGSSGKGTDTWSARLMDAPGGQVLVAAVGLGIAAVGVALVVAAVRESYLKHVDGEGRSGHTAPAVRWTGRVGHAAKGLALGAVAWLFVDAAITHEAKKSGGLDQALVDVLDQAWGPVVVAAIGIGFAAYGVFCLLQARYLDR